MFSPKTGHAESCDEFVPAEGYLVRSLEKVIDGDLTLAAFRRDDDRGVEDEKRAGGVGRRGGGADVAADSGHVPDLSGPEPQCGIVKRAVLPGDEGVLLDHRVSGAASEQEPLRPVDVAEVADAAE